MAEPRCPYFGKCGGCTAQHIEYSLQLENKRKLLASSARMDLASIKAFSGPEYGYRNRMDFIFHARGLGFREGDKWWKIIDVENCMIAEPKINELLSEVRLNFQGVDVFDIKKKSGTFRYAVTRTSRGACSVSFVLNEDSSRLNEAIEEIKSYAEHSSANNIAVAYVPSQTDVSISSEFFLVKGSEMLEEEYLSRHFQYSVQGFFQNNHAMAEKLHEYVHGLIKKHDTKRMHLLDLYGGVGTFGIINAGLFKGMTSVESAPECTAAAKKNIELNGVKNGQAVFLDARMIKKLELPQDLFVITDPPRSGMHPDTIANLLTRKPKVIIYISCNLHQLSKDLPKFYGYEVKSAALFDLFPQTPHCEGVVELVNNN